MIEQIIEFLRVREKNCDWENGGFEFHKKKRATKSSESRAKKYKKEEEASIQRLNQDVWTKVRGYELFQFHYLRRDKEMPLYNPWKTNLGKLIVPNVFVSVKLIETLVKNYNFGGGIFRPPIEMPFLGFLLVH